jgi:hypothetical protein
MHPKILRPAISTQVFLVFLCLQENTEMVPKFQVATARFSCSPPYLNSSNLSPCCCRTIKLLNFSNHHFIIHEKQNSAVCLNLSLLTTLRSSLSFYPCQKDERAVPGKVITTRCSFLPPEINRLSLLPQIFGLLLLLYCPS